LRIAYLGGSLTEGYGASDPEIHSWRARTTAYFREQFPSAEVHEIYAAIGGTGSYLGAFRLERDVLAAKPDLVFVEFAVNDGNVPKNRVIRSLEGIIRHIHGTAPECEIVLVLNATEDHFTDYSNGKIPEAVATHQSVANYYGLPTIESGRALWREVNESRATPADLFIDHVHPTDAGYRIYSETVREFLVAALAAPKAVASEWPSPMTANPLDRATLIDAWSITDEGWRRCDESLAGRYPHYLESTAPGAAFSFEFHGTDVGLYWLVASDSGEIEATLDGQNLGVFTSWDHYALSFTRANYVTLAEDISPGQHTLNLRVLPTFPGQSTGCVMRIGALLVQ